MSVLNPEAPEFYPHLKSVTKGGYTTVHKTIRSTIKLPAGASRDLFMTYTDYNVVTGKLRGNLNVQSTQMITTELPAVKLKCSSNDYNIEKVTDANDLMLDRVNISIDTITGVNKPKDQFMRDSIASWNNQPQISKIKVGSATFIGAKNIPRPQLTFKDTVDNSESLWVPKISDKPNSLKPLALSILYNENGEAVGYEHPYQVELDAFEPAPEWLDPDAPEPEFPSPLADTPLTLVETKEALDQLVDHLSTVTQMAIDLEHHNYRTYQGITCLIQITTDEGGDFIIDALAVREHVQKLNLIFTDPKKLKVFHGADSDVIWLQRDFGVYLVGMFDTYQAARVLKLPQMSLKHLLMKYCNVSAEKKYQLADWRIRPLPSELVEYARSDTHYLLYVWRKIRQDLLAAEGMHPRLLRSVFGSSQHICGQMYKKTVIDETSHLPLYVRSRKSFNSRQMAALRLLYCWRDAHARTLDESTMYLLPNHMMLALADALPREVQGVTACCSPMPPFVKQNVIQIHRMILSCRELPLEPTVMTIPPALSRAADPAPVHAASHNVHDFDDDVTDFSQFQLINLEQASEVVEEYPPQPATVPAMTQTSVAKTIVIVSELNANAKLFIPPFDRYKKYRSLAQTEELREFKEKEAKVAAISKGNELIKREVLDKIQVAKNKVETETAAEKKEKTTNQDTVEVHEKRKRKISGDKIVPHDVKIDTKDKQEFKSKNSKNTDKSKNVKPYMYSNANYRKFFDEEKAHKQPKTKFKKHK